MERKERGGGWGETGDGRRGGGETDGARDCPISMQLSCWVCGKKRRTIDFCCNTSPGIRIRSMRGRNASRNSRERHRLRERRGGKRDFGRWRFCVPVSLPSLCQCCSSFRSSLSSLRSSIISVRHLIVRPVAVFVIVSLRSRLINLFQFTFLF
jgi:hypothetical protein